MVERATTVPSIGVVESDSTGHGRIGRVTIKDVARAANVSITTVSHVVNETRHVATATRARVDQAIAELGYRPSSVARALKADRTQTLGMIVTSSTNPFFASVIRGVEEACFARGYSLILCNTGDIKERLSSYLSTLLEKRIDGLVAMTTNMDLSFFDELAGMHAVPMAVIDTLNVQGATIVNDDSTAGGGMAADFLAERGFERIAVLAGPQGHPRSQQRLDGFVAAMAGHGQMINRSRIFETELDIASGHDVMADVLSKTNRFDAVFCLNDLLAIGALCAAAEAGVDVPNDLSIIGYDDIEMAAYTVPPLTTIRQPAQAIGETAADSLIDSIEGRGHGNKLFALTPELIERQSVGYGPNRKAAKS